MVGSHDFYGRVIIPGIVRECYFDEIGRATVVIYNSNNMHNI